MSFGQSGDILDSRTEEPGMERECPVCTPKGTTGPEGIPEYKHDFGDGGYKPPQNEHTRNSATSRQVSGGHYTACKIQPVEYALANGLNYCESLALRYITRHRRKNGAEDVRKAIHCLELLLEQEYGETPYSSPQEALEQIVDRKDYIRRSYDAGSRTGPRKGT